MAADSIATHAFRLAAEEGEPGFREVPGYRVYYDLLARVDLGAMAVVLNEWLRARARSLPGALAVDGKLNGETIGTLSWVDHEKRGAHAQGG